MFCRDFGFDFVGGDVRVGAFGCGERQGFSADHFTFFVGLIAVGVEYRLFFSRSLCIKIGILHLGKVLNLVVGLRFLLLGPVRAVSSGRPAKDAAQKAT